MLAMIMLVVGTIGKAMLTGIGLATGFAVIAGVPSTTQKWAEARIEGHERPTWRHVAPQWLLNIVDGKTGVTFTDENTSGSQVIVDPS